MANSVEQEQAQPGVTYIQDDGILMSGIDKNGDLIHGEEEIEVESGEENGFDSANDLCRSFGYSLIGKTFDSADDAYDFYNEYGLSKGFGIRKSYHNKHSVTKEIYRHVFVCNKEGYKDMNDKRTTENVKRRCIKRTRCNAMIRVKLSNDEKWVVEKFLDEHNHPFDIPSHVPRQWSHKSFHRSKECKDLVTLLSKEGIRPSEITKIVNAYRGNHEDKLTRVQCSTIVSNERRRNLGKECHGVIMHFKERDEVDKDFYFATDLSTDGTLRNVFWADGRSRSSYSQFGDVVIFVIMHFKERDGKHISFRGSLLIKYLTIYMHHLRGSVYKLLIYRRHLLDDYKKEKKTTKI
ncbi:FAR1-related sequence 5-like protein [Tanacetum coccineum]